MKYLILTLTTLTLLIYSCSDKAKLTEQELKDCKTFKELKGQDRYDEIGKITHMLPSIEHPDTKITVKEQLEEHFGEPDEIRDDGTYVYVLNGSNKSSCTFVVFFNESDLIDFLGFENCRDF